MNARVPTRLAAVVVLLAAWLGLMTAAAPAAGQDYPSKPIRLNVPFPPGGGTDIVSRVVASKLSQTLGQPVVIENKPGAGGNSGVDLTAKAAPDGYTLVMGQTSNLAINPSLYARMPYDPERDLAPVALVADAPLAIVVAAGAPYRSLADMIAAAKARPEALTVASPGNGTVSHLAAELLQGVAGIKMQHIPYKGSSQALTDLIGGRIDVFMASVPTAFAQIKGGRVRAIAVTGTRRSAVLPDTPTVAESGYPGFDARTWYAILAPAGTPRAIVERLNGEINAALRSADVRDKIQTEGGDVTGGSPEAFAALLTAERAKWAEVVRASGAKVD